MWQFTSDVFCWIFTKRVAICNTEHVGEINVELHRRRKGIYFSHDVDNNTLPKKFKLKDISHRLSPSSP